MARNTIARSLHDIGLAAWFGGSLMGAVGLNAAAGAVSDPSDSGRVANTGWDRWTPVNAGAIGAHLAGATLLLAADSKRIAAQKGVATMSGAKIVLTAAALGVTAYSRIQGRKVSEHRDVPVQSATVPDIQTPSRVAEAQEKLRSLQWAVPALTGALIALSSYAGEQQRYTEVKHGVAQRFHLAA